MSGYKRVIYAPNIHTGGGKILLESLLEELQNDSDTLYILDERMKFPLNIKHPQHIVRVKPSILSRIKTELSLRGIIGNSGIVLCLGNLPPFIPIKADIVLFIQNRLLVDPVLVKRLSFLNRIKLSIERTWLKYRKNATRRIIVQTHAMRQLIASSLGKSAEILPFFDQQSLEKKAAAYDIKKKYDYLYVASGEPHKNHKNLVNAWIELSKQGFYPSLCLTLRHEYDDELISWVDEKKHKYKLNIHIVGDIKYEGVVALYKTSSSLIYPSYTESFGLPLIEAACLGMPILAAKMDYVLDVVKPTLKFDPDSIESIVSAINSNTFESATLTARLVTPNEFLTHVFG